MNNILRKIRHQYRKPGMVEKLYAVVLPAAFLPFAIIFVLLWRYCSGMFSDSIRLSAEESFRSRQNQLQILLDDYLEMGDLIMRDDTEKLPDGCTDGHDRAGWRNEK